MPVIIFASLASIYLATLTSNYYWDGITFALQIEKVAAGEAGISLLFHQNHLLYNAVGYLLYSASHAVGLNIRALYLLQIANALISACAVVMFYRIVEGATRSRYVAIVSSIALASSAVWWKLSTDADAYILSLLLILICAKNLLGPRPRWYVAGLALAGSMLIHQLASLFFFAAVVAVLSSKRIERKVRFAAAMGALAWSVTIAVYCASAITLHGLTQPLQVVRWAISNQSGVTPTLNPVRGLALLPRANLDLILGHRFDLLRQRIGWLTLIVAIAATMISIALVRVLIREERIMQFVKSLRKFNFKASGQEQLLLLIVAWVGVYLLFLVFWEPWQVYYRIFYAPALALALAAALGHFHGSTANAPRGAALLAVTTLALLNLAFYIAPNMRDESNALVHAARYKSPGWNEKTIVLFGNRNEADTAFEYFNIQSQWRKIRSASPDYLDSLMQSTYNQGRNLWLNKGAVESIDPEWLAKHATGNEIRVDAPGASALYVELAP